MIAFRPAALSFRFIRVGAVDVAGPDCFLVAAHLFRWAAAILARAAEDIRRLNGAGAVLLVVLGLNIWRSPAILALSRFFCCPKPNIVAAMIGFEFCRHASWYDRIPSFVKVRFSDIFMAVRNLQQSTLDLISLGRRPKGDMKFRKTKRTSS